MTVLAILLAVMNRRSAVVNSLFYYEDEDEDMGDDDDDMGEDDSDGITLKQWAARIEQAVEKETCFLDCDLEYAAEEFIARFNFSCTITVRVGQTCRDAAFVAAAARGDVCVLQQLLASDINGGDAAYLALSSAAINGHADAVDFLM